MQEHRGIEKPIFRIFLSSTFEDLREERNALQREVFPRLDRYCRSKGFEFRVIDLRWGIGEQASLNQQTVNICLEEIQRCQDLSPKPNFLVLLGNRYGWRPPPPQIPAVEFEQLMLAVASDKLPLLKDWYKKDENAVPPEYCLQPRERGGKYESYAAWNPIERELRDALLKAALDVGLREDAAAKYLHSATHQEISAGALSIPDAENHVLCFFRDIQDLPDDASSSHYRDFQEVDEEEQVDGEAQKLLQGLREMLREQVGSNIFSYQSHWQSGQPSMDHLDQLCDDVYRELKRIIDQALLEPARQMVSGSEKEVQQQIVEELAQGISGRDTILADIISQLETDSPSPILLWGKPGSGKSSTLAELISRLQEQDPENEIIFRFIGFTPTTADAVSLFSDLCAEIYQRFNLNLQKNERLKELSVQAADYDQQAEKIRNEYRIPPDIQGLLSTFLRFLDLSSSSRQRLIVFDGVEVLDKHTIDQIVRWIPAEFPENTRFLLSLSSRDFADDLQKRLPGMPHYELQPLTAKDGRQILDNWLASTGRNLQDWQIDLILTNFLAGGEGLPLYLKLAFEQAKKWKSYQAQEDIQLGSDLGQVVEDLMDNLSSADSHGPLLLSRVIAYLSSSRNGLGEEEVLGLLSRDPELYRWFFESLFHFPPDLIQLAQKKLSEDRKGTASAPIVDVIDWLKVIQKDPGRLIGFLDWISEEGGVLRLPTVFWSRLYADLKPYLSLRNGDGTKLLRLSMPILNELGRRKYLPERMEKKIHARMAAYFKAQETFRSEDLPNLRKLSELPYQQANAGLLEDLEETLLDFVFLDIKNQSFGPEAVIADFRLAEDHGKAEPALEAIRVALELSAHILAQDRAQLPSQLTGRLLSNDENKIQTFLSEIKGWKGRPWLRPLAQSLRSPGGALLRTYSEYSGRHILLNDGSILIGGRGGYLHQITSPEFTVSDQLIHPGSRINLLGLDAEMERIVFHSSENGIGLMGADFSAIEKTIQVSLPEIGSGAFFPGGSIILASSREGALEAWDLENETQIVVQPEAGSSLIALLPSRIMDCVVSVRQDGTLQTWKVSPKREIIEGRSFTIHRDEWGSLITTATLAEDEQSLYLGYMDGSIAHFDLSNGTIAARHKIHSEWVTAITIFPGMDQCLSGGFDGSLIIWDVNAGIQLARYEGHQYPVRSISVLPDLDVAATSTEYDLKLWNLKAQEINRQGERVTALALSPDGKKAVAACDTRYAWSRTEADTFLSVLDLETGQIEKRVNLGRHYWVNDLVVFSDNRRVMCACMYWQESLVIFDLKSGKSILPLPFNRSSFAVQINQEENRIFSGGEDGLIRIWNLDSFSEEDCLIGHADEITALNIFRNDTRLISAAGDRTLRVWDIENREEIITILYGEGLFEINDIQVSTSGRYALTSGSSINLWDLENGTHIQNLSAGYSGEKLLDDPEWGLISGKDRRRFSVFDPVSGQLIADFSGEGIGLTRSAVVLDGSIFVVGGASGAVHLLELMQPDL